MSAANVLHAVAFLLPWVFLVASAGFILWALRRQRPPLRTLLSVLVLAGVVGSFWGLANVALETLGNPQPDLLVARAFLAALVLTLAGAFDVWLLATSRVGTFPTAALTFLACCATVPALVFVDIAIENASTGMEARTAQAAADKLVSDRSSAMTLVVQDARVTLAGPIPSPGQGTAPVDAKVRLHLVIHSTAAVAVDTNAYSYIVVDTSKTLATSGEVASFGIEDPALPATIPVGDTPLDVTLDGGVTAGAKLPDPAIAWTLVVSFHGPNQLDYRITTTLQPTFDPIPTA